MTWHFSEKILTRGSFCLQGAMDVALGSAAAGVFTNSDWLWEQLHKVLYLQSQHLSLSAPQPTNAVLCLCRRLVLWQVTECGGCLCSSTTPNRWLTASWPTSTTLESTAGTYLCLRPLRTQASDDRAVQGPEQAYSHEIVLKLHIQTSKNVGNVPVTLLLCFIIMFNMLHVLRCISRRASCPTKIIQCDTISRFNKFFFKLDKSTLGRTQPRVLYRICSH